MGSRGQMGFSRGFEGSGGLVGCAGDGLVSGRVWWDQGYHGIHRDLGENGGLFHPLRLGAIFNTPILPTRRQPTASSKPICLQSHPPVFSLHPDLESQPGPSTGECW